MIFSPSNPQKGRKVSISPGAKELSIFQHTYVFWIGDLNYRLDMKKDELFEAIEKKDWDALLVQDQLGKEIQAGQAFGSFEEGKIDFQPSYKFDKGTNQYDTSPKKRLPAYCDRILWLRNDEVQCLAYKCHMDLKASDHKPVSALIKIPLHPSSLEPAHPSPALSLSRGFVKKSHLWTTLKRSFLRSPFLYLLGLAVLGTLTYWILLNL